ncbi:retropepsin-like aspartic protease family protein [Baaleninema sp.]|uniref:retropepsin-like aspartic protease family protein n=1 Tax=Baaleninema sp. TaxID=3101197 RepID=UPI003D02C017
MKRTLAALLSAFGFVCFQGNAIAQEYEGCFLIDPAGNIIDLGDLCPSNPPPAAAEPTSTPSPTRTSANVAQVPIVRRMSGIPVVHVNFNGGQRFEMLLDTGASNTVITQEMARRLQVERVGNIQIDTASQRNVNAEVGLISSMELGGIVARNVPVTIAPETLEIGLLGQDFFGRYDLTVRENVIEFARRN